MSSKTEQVIFRLDQHHFKKLEEAAQESDMSVNLEARKRVIQSLSEGGEALSEIKGQIDSLLDDERIEEIKRKLEALEERFQKFEKNFSLAVQAIMVAATTDNLKISADDAKRWTSQNLSP